MNTTVRNRGGVKHERPPQLVYIHNQWVYGTGMMCLIFVFMACPFIAFYFFERYLGNTGLYLLTCIVGFGGYIFTYIYWVWWPAEYVYIRPRYPVMIKD